MVRVTDELALSPDSVICFHASDPLLGHLPVVIFHGASTTSNYTLNSSRVQIHVFTPAGLQSYPRLTVSPQSPFYGAVNHLPREFQGDEVYRGLAFGLCKYFTELQDGVKAYLRNAYPTRGRRPGSGASLFGEQHVAELVASMVKSDNTPSVISALQDALQTQHITNIDLDFILPPGAIVPLQPDELEDVPQNDDDILDPTLRQYGGYTPLIRLLGESVFLPTSRLRRAPSKPTALNRSKSFSTQQKIDLRMKLAELIDTEERYVLKLNELAHHVTREFRESANSKPDTSLSAAERELKHLFPGAADRILDINSGFLKELRRIMDETEDEAIRDMETSDANFMSPRAQPPGSKPKDPSGALIMARMFLEWFPRFTDCYQDYIKASHHFPTVLNNFFDEQSTFRQRAAQSGEQAVRSTLIEPVQRLPRYSLLIDQIVACLPMTHPALQPMLKARDIITTICSLDDPSPDKPHIAGRFRGLVEAWPSDLEPQGRLISAVDFIELSPPFQATLNMTEDAGILLLFTDCIVILKKLGAAMSGRDLLREIDKPSANELLISLTNAAGGQAAHEYAFTGWHSLADVKFTESLDGNLTWLTSMQTMKAVHPGDYKTSKAATSRCLLLQDAYEGRAAKFGEEVVKARIESRFSEVEREDPCWTLRSVRTPDSNLGLHAAVFQEGADQLIEGRKEPASIRVVVDYERGTKGAPVGHYGVEVVVAVNAGDLKKISFVTVGLNGKEYEDEVVLADFLPALTRRIIHLMSTQFNTSNLELTAPLVSYYTKVLRCLSFTAATTRAEKTRSFLATSPVKLFSSLWNGGAATAGTPDSVMSTKQPLLPSLHRNNSFHSVQGSIRGRDDRSFVEDEIPDNPLMRLELTFSVYTNALLARKGTIISKHVLQRHTADELLVNEIYNKLIENPYDAEISPEVPVEVIFVSFENFLRIAWKSQMGAVMTMEALDTLQDRAHRKAPGDFADFVHYLSAEMAPQNRRAFARMIKLLAQLLDGCANDGDRGALTVTFAELLVTSGNASDYINLLDRLVEECDRIFNEPSPEQSFNFGGSVAGSMRSTLRKETSMTGSVTSNTSSLRRKFGLDMFRRPKEEKPSVWRSLSKHRNPATGETSSLRGASQQSRYLDDSSLPRRGGMGQGTPSRRPIAGAFDESPRPASSHRLEYNIDAEEQEKPAAPRPRAKRRSSLSDLKMLMEAATLEDQEQQPQPLKTMRETSGKINAAPAQDIIHSSFQVPTVQKENSPLVSPSKLGSPTKPAIKHSKALSTSVIPTLAPSRSDPSMDDPERKSRSPTRSGQRLRLNSPQKLRERMAADALAVDKASGNMQTVLSNISEEVSKVHDDGSSQVRALMDAVRALEIQVPKITQELQDRQAATQKEMDTTFKATETKMRAVDQLHKEVTAENELLYEKFNGELGRIIKALKSKGKDEKEELMTRLKEQSDETARMKKENARLKREIVSLKAMVRSEMAQARE